MNTKTFVLIIFSAIFFGSCSLLDGLLQDTTPTKQRMEGVWEVISVEEYTETDTLDIYDTLNLSKPVPPYIHIKDNTYFASTAGPLFLYIVYGRSKWTQIMSKLDEVFDYAQYNTTDGRYFIAPGVVDSFTINVTLQPPSAQTFKTVLELLGVGNGYLESYLEHKFYNVSIDFEDFDYDTMVWEWTDNVVGEYNKLDSQGNPVLWNGWPATKFSRCKITLVKKLKTLNELIDESTN